MCSSLEKIHSFLNFSQFMHSKKQRVYTFIQTTTTEQSIYCIYSDLNTGPRNRTYIKDNLLNSGNRLYLFN